MSRLRKFLDLAPGERLSLLEAVLWLAVARLALLLLPFRWIAVTLGRHMAQSPQEAAAPTEVLQRISWAVAAASRHLPWDCACLAQALAAKGMLKCRGVASTLYLGLAKAEASRLQAHAWLRCGKLVLTGAQGLEEYTVIATFAEDVN